MEISAPPQDLISRVQFSPNGSSLLASSWDNTVRVYSSSNGSLQTVSDMSAPLLDATWSKTDSTLIYTAGLEKVVYEINTTNRRLTQKGQNHDGAVTSLTSRDFRLVSGSLDKQIQYIDTRAPPGESQFVQVPGKVYSMDSSEDGNMLVVAMSNRLIHIYDLRGDASRPVVERETTLRYPTRTIKCVPKGVLQGSDTPAYVVTSIEGRAALEYVDPGVEGFGFRCHRAKTADENIAYPVNALAFDPKNGALFTGGSDQACFSWDLNTKKKLKISLRQPLSIMSLDFDHTGHRLAIGSSNDSYREDPVQLGGALIESGITLVSL